MGKYILKRLLIAIPTLIGITIIDYAIMCLAGNPLEMMAGPRVSQEAIAVREAALGLDQPFYIQYLMWVGKLLQGNMGYSIKSYQSVSAMIGSHLGPTLLLMGVSLLVSLLIAVPAGIYSAIHQYSKGDYAVVEQHPELFPVPAAGLSVYGEAGNPAFRGHDHTGYLGRGGGCGGPYGDACPGAGSVHGGDQYPLYPQRGAGNPSAGLSEDGPG